MVTTQQLGLLYTHLRQFKDRCGRYPTTAEGLRVLATVPKHLRCEGEPIDPLAGSMRDGYGAPLKYKSDGKTFRVDASHGYYVTNKSPSRQFDGKLAAKGAPGAHWDNPDPPQEGPAEDCSAPDAQGTKACW